MSDLSRIQKLEERILSLEEKNNKNLAIQEETTKILGILSNRVIKLSAIETVFTDFRSRINLLEADVRLWKKITTDLAKGAIIDPRGKS